MYISQIEEKRQCFEIIVFRECIALERAGKTASVRPKNGCVPLPKNCFLERILRSQLSDLLTLIELVGFLINSRVDMTMSVCPYERLDLRNYKRQNVDIKHAASKEIEAAQDCFQLFLRPQTAHICHAHTFEKRFNIFGLYYLFFRFPSICREHFVHLKVFKKYSCKFSKILGSTFTSTSSIRSSLCKQYFGKLNETQKTNRKVKKYQSIFQKCVRAAFCRLWA